MAKEKNDNKPEDVKVTYTYNSHTACRFTFNAKEYHLFYSETYNDLPADSKVVQNLIAQKKLVQTTNSIITN